MKYQRFTYNLLVLIFFGLSAISCVQQGEASKKISTGTAKSSGTNTSTTSSSQLTYFQLGTTNYPSSLSLNYDYTDVYYMRGLTLSEYITNNPSATSNLCTAIYFPYSNQKKLALFAAQKQSVIDYKTGKKEYYLRIQPNNKTLNQTNCANAGLISSSTTLFSTTSSMIVYSLQEICVNCNRLLESSPITLFQASGARETVVPLSHLKLVFLSGSQSLPSTGSELTCTTTENCTALGYQCCVSGICANDGQIRTGVDTSSSEYITAAQQYIINPLSFRLYPQFYYVCPIIPTVDNTTTPTYIDPYGDSISRLAHLKELRDCITVEEQPSGITDEMVICTRTYSKVDELFSKNSNVYTFATALSDLTFRTITPTMPTTSITEVVYGNQTIASLNSSGNLVFTSNIAVTASSNDTDTLTNNSTFQINNAATTFPSGVTDKSIKVRYKVDGSCERVSSTILKCRKYYKQGVSTTNKLLARPSDHPLSTNPGNGNYGNTFLLPPYTSSTYTPIVKVDGITQAPNTEWNITWTSTPSIVVTNTVYYNQDVTIDYFVTDPTVATNLIAAKQEAINEVNQMCNCVGGVGLNCSLTTLYDDAGNVIDYKCGYPVGTQNELPLQKTVYVSSKSIPVRFYDYNGVHYDQNGYATAIGKGLTQEGSVFKYRKANNRYPEVVTPTLGRFNEIYGNIGGSGAMPPVMVEVTKDRTYDLYTSQGSFTPCTTCGTDYFSSKVVWPAVTDRQGGGYFPDLIDTSRDVTPSHNSPFRADDLIYGRACFVPATMIPWTHTSTSDITTQRRNRLNAQHFLFTNGYNRDWYGFDYGSLIGSYDGTNWFAIGSSRRTKAKSNRLFLAVNGYFGDITLQTSYTVNISEVVTTLSSDTIPTNDLSSDGAQCQNYHLCSNDNDCIRKLGYEYTCSSIMDINTTWPSFNSIAREVARDSVMTSFANIIGGSNGHSKRCIYRGRGAPCTLTGNDPYATTTANSTNMCAPNYHCASLSTANFNNRLSRFAAPTRDVYENYAAIMTELSSSATTPQFRPDTFGLGAPLLGRPWNYNGVEKPNSQAVSTVATASVLNISRTSTTNAVRSICVPGVDLTAVTFTNKNENNPTVANGDRILGIGITASSVTADSNFLAFCPATDTSSNYTYYQFPSATASSYINDSIAQNISTVLLATSAFSSIQDDLFSTTNLAQAFTATIVKPAFQTMIQNQACMRAPGAPCLTDFECAPNTKITGLINNLPSWSFSDAEKKFWTETLICGQEESKYYPATNIKNDLYDITKNRCCREIAKTITVYPQYNTQTSTRTNSVSMDLIAGVHMSINDPKRYTRAHTIYNLTHGSNSYRYPPLLVADSNALTGAGTGTTPLISDIYSVSNQRGQYNTLHEMLSRSCCTGNWVRNFNPADPSLTGDHNWSAGRSQTIDPQWFKCLNWSVRTATYGNADFTCSASVGGNFWSNPAECSIKNFLSSEISTLLTWMGKLELTGIPQIALESHISASDYFRCSVDESMQTATSGSTPFGAINPAITSSIALEYASTTAGEYYASAADSGNFTSKIKKIFSDNQFTCCIPSGTYIAPTESNDKCCTGTRSGTRCCLPDFTDVSVYLNRYVSSEAALLPDSAFDPETGYITDHNMAQALADAKQLCCSQKTTFGFSIGNYFIPGTGGSTNNMDFATKRFIYDTDEDKSKSKAYYEAVFYNGLKWNNHVYCVPASFSIGSGTGASAQ